MYDTVSTCTRPLGTERVDIVRLVPDGAGGSVLARFTKPVGWIVETSSDVVFVHGGEELMRGSSFSDHYGLLGSVEGAVEEANDSVTQFKVVEGSTLEIRVEASLVCTAVIDEPRPGSSRRTSYDLVPRDWIRDRPGIEEDARARALHVVDGPAVAHVASSRPFPIDETVVWSSSWPPGKNEGAIAEYRRHVLDLTSSLAEADRAA
jgi:hypothetical protein